MIDEAFGTRVVTGHRLKLGSWLWFANLTGFKGTDGHCHHYVNIMLTLDDMEWQRKTYHL